MPSIKLFNPEIDFATGANTIDGYTIPLLEHKAYISNSMLEIVSAKAFVKGLKQMKYTRCKYVDSM